MATHSSILACKVSWMKELGGPQSIRSQRVGHDWACTLDPIERSHFSHQTQMQKYILKFFIFKTSWEDHGLCFRLDFSLSFPWEFNEGIDFHGYWRGQERSGGWGLVPSRKRCVLIIHLLSPHGTALVLLLAACLGCSSCWAEILPCFCVPV